MEVYLWSKNFVSEKKSSKRMPNLGYISSFRVLVSSTTATLSRDCCLYTQVSFYAETAALIQDIKLAQSNGWWYHWFRFFDTVCKQLVIKVPICGTSVLGNKDVTHNGLHFTLPIWCFLSLVAVFCKTYRNQFRYMYVFKLASFCILSIF